MAVNTGNTLKNIHNRVHDGAQVAVTSDFTAQIVGYEGATFKLVRQIPWAVLTPGEAMEVPGPMGTVHWQATQAPDTNKALLRFWRRSLVQLMLCWSLCLLMAVRSTWWSTKARQSDLLGPSVTRNAPLLLSR